ncbi:MAG: hypothetical protein JWO65_1978 [Sphingomonas bacterium]|nr:hypothetical protein [Sphingomonas bacterium]
MIRDIARGAALLAVALDLAGAWLDYRQGAESIALGRAAVITAIALVPCGIAFLMTVRDQFRRPPSADRHIVDSMRLPIVVPRGYVGAAVLGGIATLAAMGERFGFYIFLAGIALIALALSQASPRRAAHI